MPRMRMARSALPGLLAAFLVVLPPGLAPPAAAKGSSFAADWLPPASHIGRLPKTEPQTPLTDPDPSYLVRLGALVFRSPEILGGDARGIGLSCNACHAGGDRNRAFFIPGLSGSPGTVDLTNHLWNPENEDHRADPVRIPSLRDVSHAAPYGFRGQDWSLRDFVHHVITVEFAGAEPNPEMFNALIAYLDALAPLPNPLLQPDGSLTAKAPAAARQGERIFDQACAACHVPEHGFRDRQRHDVGSGGKVETPGLLGIAAGGPYFHDGRYATLDEVLAHHKGDLSPKAAASTAVRADLVAYLEAIGGGEHPSAPVTMKSDFARLANSVALLHRPLAAGDGQLAGEISLMLRDELGRIALRFPGEAGVKARGLLVTFGRDLDRIGQAAAAGNFVAARQDLADLEPAIAAAPAKLAPDLSTSLYRSGPDKSGPASAQ